MSVTSSTLRRHWLELAWAAFATANVVVIVALEHYPTVPFHLVWVSLTLLYGYRVWALRTTAGIVAAVSVATAAGIAWAARSSGQWDELSEVPLMAAMFAAMVVHARRGEAAHAQLQAVLETQADFVRDASHELRTPITVARGHAELIRIGSSDLQVRRDVDIVVAELDRLQKIGDGLLTLAASGHSEFLRREPVDVGRLVDATWRRWHVTAERRWFVRMGADGVLLADANRLACALDALIDNAVRATREEDSIALACRADGKTAIFEVSDNGSGIPREHLPRIFDRFSRADSSRARTNGGTGLGLAIVKAIAEAHGGQVTVESEPGRGSTFRMHIPGFRPGDRAARDQSAVELKTAAGLGAVER